MCVTLGVKLKIVYNHMVCGCDVVMMWLYLQCVDVSSCGNFCVVGYSSGHVDMFNMQSGIHRGSYVNNGNTGIHTDILLVK